MHHTLKGASADVSLLLKGNAVNYLDRKQETPAVTIGDWQQSHPAQMGGDVESLMAKGVNVYFLKEDLEDRGISKDDLIPDAKMLNRSDLVKLFDDHDLVFQW